MFAKGLAILQGGWVIIQAIARTAQGLPLAPLEIFTLAFVVSTAMSYYFWWRKPQHVSTPTVLECLVPMARIRAEAGCPPDVVEGDTPMDFVEKQFQFWKRRPMFEEFDLDRGSEQTKEAKSPGRKVLGSKTSAGGDGHAGEGLARPNAEAETTIRSVNVIRQRIPDDSILPNRLPLKLIVLLIIPSVLHGAIHLIAWNHPFPTQTELYLWRTSIIALLTTSCLSVGVMRILGLAGYQGRYTLVWVWVNANADTDGTKRCSSSPTGFRLPGGWDVVISVATLLLVVARCCLIAEVCVSLRLLPAATFVDVNWPNFIPHI